MRVAIAVCALVSAGCLAPGGVECDDGRLCPSGTICVDDPPGCVLDEQIGDCLEDELCELPGGDTGVCHGDVCRAILCGDGLVDGAEECDGDVLPDEIVDCTDLGYHGPGTLSCGDDCTIDRDGCAPEGICGDGALDAPFEQCDDQDLGGVTDCMQLDYYDPGTVGCTALCRYDVSACSGLCGDGTHDPEELCEGTWTSSESCLDFGYDVGALDCTAQCAPSFAGCDDLGWRRFPPPGVPFIDAVWASGPGDVWVVGDEIGRFDGTTWTFLDTTGIDTFFLDITGTGPDDVWLTGFGDAYHWDGTSLAPDSPETPLNAVASFALPGHVWIATIDDEVYHRDVSGWTGPDLFAGEGVTAIFGFAPDDLWLVTSSGLAAHHDGTGWETTPVGQPFLGSLWGSAPDDLWAGGNGLHHWDGVAWSTVIPPEGEPILQLSGTAWNDVWAIGAFGSIFHYDGVAWAIAERPESNDIRGIFAIAPDLVWTAGMGGAFRLGGAGWGRLPASSDQGGERIVSATRVDDVWACHDSDFSAALAYYDGVTWTDMSTCQAGGASLGPGEAWSVQQFGPPGFGTRHWDGTTWSNDTGHLGNAIYLAGPDRLWLVGFDLYERAGTTWTLIERDLFGEEIWGTGPDDVWVVGGQGAIRHWNGAIWTDLSIALDGDLHDVWGSGPDDVYIVGDGTLLHHDGVALTPVDAALADNYRQVWGTAPDDVWVGGELGMLLHYDGVAWSRVRVPDALVNTDIHGIAGVPRHVWISGDSSLDIIHLDRTVRWTCRAAETGCGDAVDDDCDGAIDDADSDCADTARLAEVHLGSDGFVEVVNRTDETINLTGLQLASQLGCESAKTRYTFPVDALVPPGARFRVIEGRDVGARERWLDDAMCDGATTSGWVMLCAGPCDVVTCRNLIDVVAFDGPGAAPVPPACAPFAPAPVNVTAAGAGDAVVRTGYSGTGAAADWTVSPATRD